MTQSQLLPIDASMTLHIGFWSGVLLCALAGAGCIYQLIAWSLIPRFFSRPANRQNETTGITLLKPLHGREPFLLANLESFCRQDVTGPVQIAFGVNDPADPAVQSVSDLRAQHPAADIALTTSADPAMPNKKIANLAAIMNAAKYDVLVMSDSDMVVPPDYLTVIGGTLAQPDVGAVTCLYRGRADCGFWSSISAGAISYVQFPAMLLGYMTGMAQPCMGSTIAVSRQTLNTIGGFERFGKVLADDYAIGEAVGATGQRVVIPPMLLIHACSETSLAALWRQKVRWASTIRGVGAWRHTGSVVIYPFPLALLGALFLPLPGLALAIVSLAIRAGTGMTVNRCAGGKSASLWLLPAIEVIEFLAFVASFVARKIDWRGSHLTMQPGGRIAADKRTL